jgi:hypothetical protein
MMTMIKILVLRIICAGTWWASPIEGSQKPDVTANWLVNERNDGHHHRNNIYLSESEKRVISWQSTVEMKGYLLLSSSVLFYCLLLLVSAVRSDDVPSNSLSIGEGRLLVVPKTYTTTSTTTQTITTTATATTSCATVAAGLAACRKRRNVIEEPIMINQDVIQAPADPQP